ncbi:tRNA 2-thiouridine(34) synthase MnmA [Dehalococcoides mccartyi]|uniref:tRNA-specific 2-thiouridylase MnmA n=1 Tax=Dehalococcoides mccartyi (strain VS) TaxID=311424 RepID=D2BHM2_DEHMV|nr:tRNA 2-thiouridine(34) synthase MnmA [Dehalococcoides mccartyi]ACZ61822.1 tRNA (5-methylaminomethyl-2-thiouridylate)-methyltransferase [Dehalococcoides mccartyi VS]
MNDNPGLIMVAMSGGVDSSVAAMLLLEQGYDVAGVSLQLKSNNEPYGNGYNLKLINRAREVAAALGIPHYVVDLSDIFSQRVIADFCQQYSQGRTPNPCIRCNYYVKIGALLDKIPDFNAGYLATGHYARVLSDGNGTHLLKGADEKKDQSYFLYTLPPASLSRLMFPLGKRYKKDIIRLAAKMKLPVSQKESQDVCFIPDGDYKSFLSTRMGFTPGKILDKTGKILGEHQGLPLYTIGQRQGLGLASNEKLFVSDMNPEANTITVASHDQLYTSRILLSNFIWRESSISIDTPGMIVKVRYKAAPAEVKKISQTGDFHLLELASPVWAATPGQAAVIYLGDMVLGGGIIEHGGDAA